MADARRVAMRTAKALEATQIQVEANASSNAEQFEMLRKDIKALSAKLDKVLKALAVTEKAETPEA